MGLEETQASVGAAGDSGDQVDDSGDQVEDSGDQVDDSGDQVDDSGDQVEDSGDQVDDSGDHEGDAGAGAPASSPPAGGAGAAQAGDSAGPAGAAQGAEGEAGAGGGAVGPVKPDGSDVYVANISVPVWPHFLHVTVAVTQFCGRPPAGPDQVGVASLQLSVTVTVALRIQPAFEASGHGSDMVVVQAVVCQVGADDHVSVHAEWVQDWVTVASGSEVGVVHDV